MKPLDDFPNRLRINKPLQIRRFEVSNRPDPGACVDCLIIVNDRTDSIPRARLELSNGASWDAFALLADARTAAAPAPAPPRAAPPVAPPPIPDLQPIVTTLVQKALAEQLPKVVPAAPVEPSAPTPAQEARTINYEGNVYPMPDLGRMALAVACANAAIAGGMQANNVRWLSPSEDFTMTTTDGKPVPLDAPDVLALGAKVLSGL